jgi:hypothetical protein
MKIYPPSQRVCAVPLQAPTNQTSCLPSAAPFIPMQASTTNQTRANILCSPHPPWGGSSAKPPLVKPYSLLPPTLLIQVLIFRLLCTALCEALAQVQSAGALLYLREGDGSPAGRAGAAAQAQCSAVQSRQQAAGQGFLVCLAAGFCWILYAMAAGQGFMLLVGCFWL